MYPLTIIIGCLLLLSPLISISAEEYNTWADNLNDEVVDQRNEAIDGYSPETYSDSTTLTWNEEITTESPFISFETNLSLRYSPGDDCRKDSDRAECYGKQDKFDRYYRTRICGTKSQCNERPVLECVLETNKCRKCIQLGENCPGSGKLPCCAAYYLAPDSIPVELNPQCIKGKCEAICWNHNKCRQNGIPCCESAKDPEVLCRYYGSIAYGREHNSYCRRDWCEEDPKIFKPATKVDLIGLIPNHPPVCRIYGLGKKKYARRCNCAKENDANENWGFECRDKKCTRCGGKDYLCTKRGNECCKEFKCVDKQTRPGQLGYYQCVAR